MNNMGLWNLNLQLVGRNNDRARELDGYSKCRRICVSPHRAIPGWLISELVLM